MKLLIARHALAASGYPDFDRPITDRGVKDIRNQSDILIKYKIKPAYVITSPLKRAVQTGALFAKLLDVPNAPFTDRALQPGGFVDDLMVISKSLNADILFVGHLPDVANHISHLVSHVNFNVEFSPGTVGCVNFDGDIIPGRGYLDFLLKPF